MNEIKPLEDLIVSILLTDFNIVRTHNGRALQFKLERSKVEFFYNYIKRFELQNYIQFNTETLEGIIKPSTMLQRYLREWVVDNEVKEFNPQKMRLNMYLLWIALFGKKTKTSVVIISNLGPDQQRTLANLFNHQFNTNLLASNGLLQVTPYEPVFIKACQTNRSIIEFIELSSLAPDREKYAIGESVTNWKEERNYAF